MNSRRRAARFATALALALAGGLCCARERSPAAAAPPQASLPAQARSVELLVPRVLAEWPHDPRAFTQGLVYSAGGLWESTGLYGRSALRRVEIETGRVISSVPLAPDLFAEGLALVPHRLWQLTWKEGRALAWDPASLQALAEARYQGEGWGLAYDGARLWMSDGSATLQVRDAQSFALERRVAVTRAGQPQGFLNELEWVEGALWANVWQSDTILRIDPATGTVTAAVDAAGLLPAADRERTDVLNGIAWNPERRVFYVTGKLWPKLFEVEFARP